MAETVDTGVMTTAVPQSRRQRAERWFATALLAALVLRLALMLGLEAMLGSLGDGPALIGTLVPWILLAIAAVAAWGFIGTLYGGLQFAPNRLRRHYIGWGIAAVLVLFLALLGPQIAPALKFLGKSAGILIAFCQEHGIFLAIAFAQVALVLAAIGGERGVIRKPGVVERIWIQNITAKIAGVPMALVAIGIFTGGTIWTVVYSFTDSRLLPRERWVGLDQYERLWGENRWIISIENLMIYGVFALVFSLVIGFLLAVLLDQKIRFENTFRTIFLYPFALSFIVTGLVWQWVLNPQFGAQRVLRSIPISWHWFENIVEWLFGVDMIGGFAEISFDPLYNQDIVIYGILIAGLWHGTGLIMCLMLAGLRGIDQEIWKATRVDGIPAWKTYIRIVIPMMRPVFITTLVLIASGIVRLYDLVVAQTSGGPGIASEVPAKYVYDKMFLGQNLAQGFAASTMMFLTVLVVLIPWAYLEFGGKKRV